MRTLPAAFLLAGALAACGPDDSAEAEARELTGGDSAAGRELIVRYGCGTCHTIGGVPGATGKVGPPLDGVAGRTYLAGRLTNDPMNMMRWIRDPKQVDPETAMPDLGVAEDEARHIASYLYTLR